MDLGTGTDLRDGKVAKDAGDYSCREAASGCINKRRSMSGLRLCMLYCYVLYCSDGAVVLSACASHRCALRDASVLFVSQGRRLGRCACGWY